MTNGSVKVVGKSWNMSIDLTLAGFKREQRVISFSNTKPTFCFEQDKIKTVVNKIIDEGFRRLPILSKKQKLVGIITTSDILNAFLRKQSFDEPVSTIMKREVIFCDANETIGYVLQKFKFSRRGGFPILEDGKLIGIISERDIVRKFANIPFNLKVEDVMTKKPFFIQQNISILDALKSIVNTCYRRLPVVEDKKAIGIVTSADVIKYLRDNDFNFSSLLPSVNTIIRRELYSTDKDKDVSDAIKTMTMGDVGGLVVIDDNKTLEGIITERDILEEII